MDPVDWSIESFDISQEFVYRFVKENAVLDYTYIKQARDIAESQIVLAGNRLANLLKSLKLEGAKSCDQECKDICCRNGGGKACVTACGCEMPCKADDFFRKIEDVVKGCDDQCKETCCRNGGGEACVTACGCAMPCKAEKMFLQ